eukprot:5699423-Prymnesium_polylepis.1
MSVVTGAPKQAAKASPNASMFVSSTAPSPRTVTRMPSSFAWCATLRPPSPSPTPRAALHREVRPEDEDRAERTERAVLRHVLDRRDDDR